MKLINCGLEGKQVYSSNAKQRWKELGPPSSLSTHFNCLVFALVSKVNLSVTTLFSSSCPEVAEVYSFAQ